MDLQKAQVYIRAGDGRSGRVQGSRPCPGWEQKRARKSTRYEFSFPNSWTQAANLTSDTETASHLQASRKTTHSFFQAVPKD